MAEEITGYELSRNWFDWCFENPDLINPTHTALYFFSIEHWNRLGQKEKFGLPTQMCMDAIGVSNWRTFSKAFNNLVEWGFFKLITKSQNQYSATVIAIAKNTKANTKALTKATQKHLQKQDKTIAVIDKPNNILTLEPITIFSLNVEFETFWNEYDKKVGDKSKLEKKWISLKDIERELIMEHIPLYKLSQPDKKFRKDPSTFLNNKSWNDEIIISNGGKQQQRSVSERSGEIDGIISAVFKAKGVG